MEELIQELRKELNEEEARLLVDTIGKLGGNYMYATTLVKMYGTHAATEYAMALQYKKGRGNISNAINEKVKAIKETTQKYSGV